jgi:hypothetical protein
MIESDIMRQIDLARERAKKFPAWLTRYSVTNKGTDMIETKTNREIFAEELRRRNEHGLAVMVVKGTDNSHGGTAAIAAMDRISAERDRLRAINKELVKTLERLGSMEAFTLSHVIENTFTGEELKARIDFARASVAKATE